MFFIGSLFFLIFVSSPPLYCQREVIGFPFFLGNYSEAYPFINPAYTAYLESEVSLGNQRFSGAWNNIQSLYALISLKIHRSDTLRHYQAIGLTAFTEQEGAYLRRNRLYGQYATNLLIRNNWNLSAGVALGAMNYLVLASAVNAGGSDTKLDGAIGIRLKLKNWQAGYAISQIFNSGIQPLIDIYRLIPMYHYTIEAQYNMNEQVFGKPLGYLRYINPQLYDMLLAHHWILANSLTLGIGYHHRRNLIFYFGLENASSIWGKLRVMFSYHTPIGKNNLANFNTFEFNVIYRLSSLKKRSSMTEKNFQNDY
ncbi:MAG: type IX secretion system membrane protein PorP/SprF [Cytophagales bacterium]|nr:type IX secretion system membrane protein PorP/SprF [Cytophagales bacterium]MDW8385033.1 type IX secretion system membrane protein PorP/SprF [Flammeovirgaceae bacterium]